MTQPSIDYATETLQQLIRYPSVNPPGDVRDITDFIGRGFDALGCRVKEISSHPTKPNLVVDLGAEDSRQPALLFYAHSDVVRVDDTEKPLWRCDPFEGFREGDTIYGRGAVDAKSKIAALLAAAKSVIQSDPTKSRRVRIIIEADGERGDQAGIQFMKQRDESDLHCDMMLACEPSELKVLRVYKGRLWIRLVAEGPNVHSLVPESGKNAISRMGEVLPRVLDTQFSQAPVRDSDMESEMMGGVTRCVTQLHSGSALNVSPGSAEASLDFRPVPGQTIEQVIADLQRTVDELLTDEPQPHLRLEPITESFREPAVLDRESPVIRAVQKAYQEALGTEVPFGTGYSVGGLQHFWDLGIPGIYFGSGGIWHAHSANESITIKELDDMTRVYAQLMHSGIEDRLT